MNCLERLLASHKSNMQYISHLNSFMDEMDQEVMSLTDRAFKSLCIGDEAVYNDSGFSLSPVEWHKPLAEGIPKKTKGNSPMDVKKHTAQVPSGLNSMPWQTNKNSLKLSPLLDKAKMTNGDSWDNSAISSERQMSEFSSDHQNHFVDKFSEKRTSRKITPTQTGKPNKNKHRKSSKLRNLNSNNYFLHSESSPFQCWGTLNRFGFEDVKFLPNKRPDELCYLPLYTKLTTSDILHFSQSNKEEKASKFKNKPKANVLTQSAQTSTAVPLDSETHTKLKSKQSEICLPQPEVVQTSSGLFQRCSSDGDLCVPWRKTQSRVKGVIQTHVSSSVCKISGTGLVDSIQTKSEVGTMKEDTSSSSTPFSISQLLTPTIPCRQETGFSGILQAALSPAGIDQPILLETEMHPSPEFRRDGYKSMASSLLFSLKDNRKRIMAMYSSPKPTGLDCIDLQKVFPLTEQDVIKKMMNISKTKDVETIPTYVVNQQEHGSHVSPKTSNIQSSPVSVQVNISFPDDFLALSLLQDKNRESPAKLLRPKKNIAAKATYPSLKLYRKTSPVEFGIKNSAGDAPNFTVCKCTTHENDDEELQRKNNLVKPVANNTKMENTHINNAETDNVAAAIPTEIYMPSELLEHNARQDILEFSGSSTQDNLNTGEKRKMEKRQAKYKGCQGMKPNHEHLFSAKQNNYIKSQRYASIDDDEYGRENVMPTGNDMASKWEPDIGKTMQYLVDETFNSEHVTHNAFIKKKLQKVAKNNAISMKGNTLAKVSLFTLKEQALTKTLPIPKNDNIVIVNYEEPTTVNSENNIAEQEQKEVLLPTDVYVSSGTGQQCGRDFAMEGENKQVSMLASNQKDTSGSVFAEGKGQKVISDFKPPSQNFQSMPDTDTKHGECHVAEVKLAEPKQEGAAEHKHATVKITYTEMHGSDRNSQPSYTDNVKATGKISIGIAEQDQNNCFVKESLVAVVPNNADNQLARPSQYKSAIQKKFHCYSPEFSLIKVREDVESEGVSRNDRAMIEQERVNNIILTSTNVHKVKANLLMDVQECFQVDGQTHNQEKDQITQKETVQKHTISAPKVETHSNNYSIRVHSNNELLDDDLKPVIIVEQEINVPDNQTVHNDITIVNDKKDKNTKESALHDSGKCLFETSVIKGFLGKSDTGKIKCGDDSEKEITKQTSPTLDELTHNKTLMNSTTYNILKLDNTSSLVDVKQLEQDKITSDLAKQSPFSQKAEGSLTQIKNDLPSQGIQLKRNLEKTTDDYDFTNSENKPYISNMTVSPTSNMDKGGLADCLKNSTSSLTPTYQSNPSSPTIGKPALFKVKDNTFSVSPVTKTVRPILHKSIPEATQPWSPGGLSGSEIGDKDPDIFLGSVEFKSPIQHTNQSPGQTVSSSTSQFTTDREKKWMNDRCTVSVDEEWQTAVSSVSGELERCRISSVDTVEDLVFNMAFTERTEGSKAPSETAESACSGNESKSHGKPPAVPPKTEKALRRAMKLTTKRIQKAEAEWKFEHGRSSEKDTSHIHERRHCSSDKLPSNSSDYKEQSTDRSSNQFTGKNKTHLSKNHTNARQPGHQESQKKEVTYRKSRNRDQSNLTNKHHDENSDKKIKDMSQYDSQSENADCKRLGRTGEKNLRDKLYRRAHSLDRFLNVKHEHLPSTECLMNNGASKKPPNVQSANIQQNSSEQTSATTTNKPVAKYFPITRRKLLQDPDSGQYFMVDMPIQTTPFFDPESGNYVQLPVQSFEASAPHTQSMEAVNAPPVVLYHGFVPMPVSSIHQQNSTINVGSVVPSEYQQVLESSDMESQLSIIRHRKDIPE